jgi:hypothetical protein
MLCLLSGAFFIHLIQKYIFRKKEPSIQDLWVELEKQKWFHNLIVNQRMKEWISADKENGLLKDPYFVRKIIENEMHRESFIRYITEKTKE